MGTQSQHGAFQREFVMDMVYEAPSSLGYGPLPV